MEKIVLNDKSTMFVDIEAVQRTMVKLYSVTKAVITKVSDKYFSVQSEEEIWPIACFQVLKETHEILKWVFQQTEFPAIIKSQEDGKELKVPGVGNFKELHRPQVVFEVQACKVAKARAHTWEGGQFDESCAEELVLDGMSDRWLPILAIPLCRVHICTQHALVRVTEEILHLHFMFIWNMTDRTRQEQAIEPMEKSL
jgi:hypothetical protein